jgi:hypothetical protein
MIAPTHADAAADDPRLEELLLRWEGCDRASAKDFGGIRSDFGLGVA